MRHMTRKDRYEDVLSSIVTLLVVPLLILLQPSPVQASITIADTSRVFPSRPESTLGHQLEKTSYFMGRLQFVHGNLQLCKSSQNPTLSFPITEPLDGLPVAIFAKAGGCSLAEKALVASTLLDPPHVVAYLVVDDDDRSERKKKDSSRGSSWFQSSEDEEEVDDILANAPWEVTETDTDEDRAGLWQEILNKVYIPSSPLAPTRIGVHGEEYEKELLQETGPTLVIPEETVQEVHPERVTGDSKLENTDEGSLTDQFEDDDDEGHPTMAERFRISNGENAWWNGSDEIQNDDFSGRRLKKHDPKKNKINVAILHTSGRVGYDILDILLKENSQTERMGGPKVYLNSQVPPAKAGTIFVWVTLCIALGACGCCCTLVFLECAGEDERTVPPPPTRRQLTLEQVRQRYPSFVYHPEHHVEQPLDDECAICLDEFTEGMHLRRLPCGHVFHASCVARWLIERHAVCPLCKMDLFEDVGEDEMQQQQTDHTLSANLRRRYGALGSFTGGWWTTSGPVTMTSGGGGTTTGTSSTLPTTVGTGGAVGAVATPIQQERPPRSFQWRWTRRDAADDHSHTGETAVETTRPSSQNLWQSATLWFGQGRRGRRGMEVRGLLTELTEPLLVSNDRGDDGRTATSPVSDSAATSTVVASGDGSATSIERELSSLLMSSNSPSETSEEEAFSSPSSSSPEEV